MDEIPRAGPRGLRDSETASPGRAGRNDRDVRRAGEEILRAEANDETGEGGGGFQCCWTSVHVRVSVRQPTDDGQQVSAADRGEGMNRAAPSSHRARLINDTSNPPGLTPRGASQEDLP